MTRRPAIIALCFGTAIAVAPLFLFQAAFSTEDTPYSTECLDCHEDRDQTLVGSAHQLNMDGAGIRIACSDCHLNAEMHMEDPDMYRPGKPDSLSVVMMTRLCSRCHANAHGQNMIERDPHGDAGINCSGCHLVHDNDQLALLRDEQTPMCLGCHQEVAGHFSKPFRHPVDDRVMSCSDCHMLQAQSHRQHAGTGVGDVCYACHARFRPPFPFEHLATIDWSTQEGGCLTCHEAHGSNVSRMLKQTYEAPNFAICTQCHSVPGHQFNSFHGNMWAGQACSNCHVDIHGSYNNRNFLTPTLEAQGCFVFGCHQL